MKLISFVFLSIFLFFNNLSAQGTLQFNQVLLLQTSQSGSVLLGTVPAGKVWKIEAVGGVPMSCFCGFSFNNGQNVAFHSGGRLEGTQYRRWETEGAAQPPIWLPAGTPLTAMNCTDCYACNSATCSFPYRYLSIIEFNVIP